MQAAAGDREVITGLGLFFCGLLLMGAAIYRMAIARASMFPRWVRYAYFAVLSVIYAIGLAFSLSSARYLTF